MLVLFFWENISYPVFFLINCTTIRTFRRQWSDQRWLNTPNNYTKEVSTLPGRQPVAHWVSSREATLRREISKGRLPPPTPFHPLTPAAVPLGTTGAQSNTPSSGMNFNRFAPQGDDPKELKEHQKKVGRGCRSVFCLLFYFAVENLGLKSWHLLWYNR